MRGNDSLLKRLFLAGVGQCCGAAVGCACTACARWVTQAAALPRPPGWCQYQEWALGLPGSLLSPPDRKKFLCLLCLQKKSSFYTYIITFLQ